MEENVIVSSICGQESNITLKKLFEVYEEHCDFYDEIDEIIGSLNQEEEYEGDGYFLIYEDEKLHFIYSGRLYSFVTFLNEILKDEYYLMIVKNGYYNYKDKKHEYLEVEIIDGNEEEILSKVLNEKYFVKVDKSKEISNEQMEKYNEVSEEGEYVLDMDEFHIIKSLNFDINNWDKNWDKLS